MDIKERSAPDGEAADSDPGAAPQTQTSKIGDLGQGSHEQTQGLTGEKPRDLPGQDPPPKGP
ncbi:MAG: hypothetical protein JWO25_1104 [Alphaproteobacteria bacterium]|nr:hypothetical protein [Alphaproteobacteria bacterium]MDB5721897.1 hypothetical protein [Alphaproteobacteria bacterium]